jgi:hypothetical protein
MKRVGGAHIAHIGLAAIGEKLNPNIPQIGYGARFVVR